MDGETNYSQSLCRQMAWVISFLLIAAPGYCEPGEVDSADREGWWSQRPPNRTLHCASFLTTAQ